MSPVKVRAQKRPRRMIDVILLPHPKEMQPAKREQNKSILTSQQSERCKRSRAPPRQKVSYSY